MDKLIIVLWKVCKHFQWRKGMELCAKVFVRLSRLSVKEA